MTCAATTLVGVLLILILAILEPPDGGHGGSDE